MQPKAVNGYSAADIDKAIQGFFGPPIYRVRADILDRDLSVIRPCTSLILDGSYIQHITGQEIKRAGVLRFYEKDIELDEWTSLVLAKNPLVFARFGESSGTTIVDSSGNSRNGTYNGTVTLQAQSLLPGVQSNPGVTFGSNGFAQWSDAAWMDVADAVSFLISVKFTNTSRPIIFRDDTSANRFHAIEVTSGGTVSWSINFTSGSPTRKTFTATVAGFDAPINDGTAHQLLCVYDKARGFVEIYVDGNRLLREAETRTMATGTLALRVGATSFGSQFINGTVDEFAMYDIGLTASEARDLWQRASGNLAEVDFDRDMIQVSVGIGMVDEPDPEDDSHWAEWQIFTGPLTSPTRVATTFNITREVQVFDQTIFLVNDKFTTHYVVPQSANVISGTNGILDIARGAGFNVTGWAVTSTTATLNNAIDFAIGTSKLEAINYLLNYIGYKPIRFRADGQAILEPKVLPSLRSPDDTLTTDAQSIIDASQIEEGIELENVKNVVYMFKVNADSPLPVLEITVVNNNINSKTSIPNTKHPNVHTEQTEAVDLTTLTNLANARLSELSRVNKRIVLKTALRPFHDDEDIIALTHTGDASLNLIANVIETEWRLPLNPVELMDHVFQLVPLI